MSTLLHSYKLDSHRLKEEFCEGARIIKICPSQSKGPESDYEKNPCDTYVWTKFQNNQAKSLVSNIKIGYYVDSIE